jgi:hypothetical protein
MTKYRSRKVTVNGIEFDSHREARRYQELQMLLRAGEITQLQLQKKYTLIPAQKKPSGGTERACTYTADFVYRDKSGKEIVEDAKGVRTQQYIIRRKLLLYVYGIEVHEV